MMEPELAALLNQTVTVAAAGARNLYGEPAYGAATSYVCRVQPSTELVRTDQGESVPARGHVYLPAGTPVTVESQITLPDGTTPQILAVHNVTDTDGASHHVKVVF